MFAERYIEKNIVYPELILTPAHPNLSVVVMIPCMNEPEIIGTLESLWNCSESPSFCEVIVLINDSEQSSEDIQLYNLHTLEKLIDWKKDNDRPNLILYPVYVPSVNPKFAGAGMARKIAMDEAIRRFNAVDKPEGVIVSLDADCLVSENYLEAIETTFQDKNCFAAILNFRHRIDSVDDLKQQKGIQLYEHYLHYYKKALDYTGFPNSIYTIGSAFAVRADAYVKQGGMNRRQAGEDLYFLNKLTQLGTITKIEDAFVFPSARVSDRVPFGTGAAMTKWMDDADDLSLTYNFSAFCDLKQLFDRVNELFDVSDDFVADFVKLLPLSIQEYLATIQFSGKITEINKNSSSLKSFRKRFFQFFDAFLVLRFLNLAHQNHYPRQDLNEASSLLETRIKSVEDQT